MFTELFPADLPAEQCHIPCRICSQVGLNPVAPPAISGGDSSYADLAWCPACSLVQWTGSATAGERPPARWSPAGIRHEQPLPHPVAGQLRKAYRLGPDSLVIGTPGQSNLLQTYHDAGIPVLVIEPVRGRIRAADTGDGFPAISARFGQELARQLVRANQQADVIHATGVLERASDLNDVVAGFAMMLKPEGVIVAEVPYLRDLADRVGFNTLDRDELCCFSLTSLSQLFGQHRLEIADIEHLRSHGGQLRIVARRLGTGSVSMAVHRLMDAESSWVRDPAFYQSFGETLAPSSLELRAA